MTPEEQAKAFFTSGMDAAKVAAIKAALDQLHAWGITDEQIKVVVDASGKTPDQLVAMGKDAAIKMVTDARTLAEGYVKAKISEEAVAAMEGLGFSKAEAQALAATGGSKEKLLALGKEKLGDIVSDLNVRLKKEGIDLVAKASSLTGLSEKELGTAAKAAGAALDIVLAVSDAFSAGKGGYSHFEWSEDFKGDASLENLASIMNAMGQESAAHRAEKYAASKKLLSSIAAGAGVAVSAIGTPIVGLAVTAGLQALTEFAGAIGWLGAKDDENAAQYGALAVDYAKKLWEVYGFVSPSFDSTAYSTASFAKDTLAFQVEQLNQAEAERPFQAVWRKVAYWAMTPPLDDPHPAVMDLRNRGWFPFQFSEWMGGAMSPTFSNEAGDIKWHWGDNGLDLFPRIPGVVGSIEDALAQGWAYRALPGIARTVNTVSGKFYMQLPHVYDPDRLFDLLPYAPRSPELQSLIRDRMAATVGTLLAAINGAPIEKSVEAAVKKSRALVAEHGFHPLWAARDFRDVFFEAAVVAGTKVYEMSSTPVSAIRSVSYADLRFGR